MSEIKKIEIQDSVGNIFYPHTESTVVKRESVNASKPTVEETLLDIETNYLKKADTDYIKGSRKSYTSITGDGTVDAWYTLFTLSDTVNSPVVCLLKAYAHTSLFFSVSKGFGGGNYTISILNYNGSSNAVFKHVKGVRVIDSGVVQIKLNGTTATSNPYVDVNAQLIGSNGINLVNSLEVYTGTVANEVTIDPLINGAIVSSGEFYSGTNKVWHQGNDGTGSGLDADLLDGKQASDFAPSGFGLGTICTQANGDWNNYYTTSGFYMGQSLLNTPPNVPDVNAWWYVLVMVHNSSYCIQIATDFNNKVSYRRARTANTWGGWVRVADYKDIPTIPTKMPSDGNTLRIDITSATLDINTLTLNADGLPNVVEYIEKSSGGANNITNIPVTGQPFTLVVESLRRGSSTDYITKQLFSSATTKAVYTRYCTNGTWTGWLPDASFSGTPSDAQLVVADGSQGKIKTIGLTIDDTKTGADTTNNNGLWTANKTKTELDKKSNTGHGHTVAGITDFPASMPANGGNADTVDNKHASDFLPTVVEKLSGTDVTAYINGLANNSTKVVRIGNGTNTPGTNGDNDFHYYIFKAEANWWTVMAVDVRTSKIWTRNCSNGNLDGWKWVSDNGNAYSVGGIPANSLIRQYSLNAINIDTMGIATSFIVNISEAGHGTTPDSGFWNILQFQGGHFLTQIGTKSQGDTTTFIRTKYVGDANWGGWSKLFTSSNSRPVLIQSTAPSDGTALWVY